MHLWWPVEQQLKMNIPVWSVCHFSIELRLAMSHKQLLYLGSARLGVEAALQEGLCSSRWGMWKWKWKVCVVQSGNDGFGVGWVWLGCGGQRFVGRWGSGTLSTCGRR